MAVSCPYCDHRISAKDAKPGKYTPKCPKCGQKLQLVVHADPPGSMTASKLPAPNETVAPKPATSGPAQSAADGLSRAALAAAAANQTKAGTPPIQAPASFKPSAGPSTGQGKPSPAEDVAATMAPSSVGGSGPAKDYDPFEDDAFSVGTPAGATPTRAAPSQGPVDGTVDFSVGETPTRAGPGSMDATGEFAPVPDVRAAKPANRTDKTVSGSANVTAEFSSAGAPAQPAPRPQAAPGAATQAAKTDQTAAVASSPSPRTGGDDIPEYLGGYRMQRLLGRGGMGAVYLARQLSLDRDVAVKVMNPRWSKDPNFVARFTREAYAAAQLVHHNVVQIYDIGADKDVNFFSMEFVRGQSLNDMLKDNQKLDANVAAGYVLQAARGLKFAHDQGLIHRDIKPDNLMLNDHEIVKVADLGLVKAAGTADIPAGSAEEPAEGGRRSGQSSLLASSANVTQANVAMGTPAFMAPEQGKDAANVDQRADVYSLGCTLYVLVTGRPVFGGNTAMEVMTKHAKEQVVPPDVVEKRVPGRLSNIVLKMVAKKPEDRYQSMDEVIKALEEFLGLDAAGTFSPKEEHAEILEKGIARFNASGMFKAKKGIGLLFLGGCGVMSLIALPTLGFLWFAALLVLAVSATVSYLVIHGLRDKTYLFEKARDLLVSGSWTDWLTLVFGSLLLLVGLFIFKLLWVFLGMGLVGVLLAAMFHFVVDGKIKAGQQPALEEVEKMLKGLRLRGIDEEALRQFVCRYSGEHWEGMYEQLFGFEAKLHARRKWGKNAKGQNRPRFSAWREPLVSWMEARQSARREAKERKHLQKVEENRLRADGINVAEARARAEQAASALVGGAAQFKAETLAANPRDSADAKRKRIRAMLEEAAEAGRQAKSQRSLLSRLVDGPLQLALGGKVRFIAGAALIVLCLIWMKNTNQFGPDSWLGKILGKQVTEQIASVDTVAIDAAVAEKGGGLFTGFNPGVAGLILVLSAMLRSGWKISLAAFPAALVVLVGHWIGIPQAGPLDAEYVRMIAGGVIALVGIFVIRK